MKKYFISIGVLVMTAAAVGFLGMPLLTRATDLDANNIAADVVRTVGTGVATDLSPTKIFSADSPGKDLYNLMYNKLKYESSGLAVKRTLAKRPLSPEELATLIPGSNLGQILAQPDPKTAQSPQEVLAAHQAFVGDLADMKKLADFETETRLDVTMTELFANGDESDSGFDLISDLNVIEAILFGKQQTVNGNSGPGAPAGANNIGPNFSGQNGGQGNQAPPGKGPAPLCGAPPLSACASGPGGAPPGGAGEGNNGGGGVQPGSGSGPIVGGNNGGSLGGAGASGGVSGPTGSVVEQPLCPLNPGFNSAVQTAAQQSAAGNTGAAGQTGAGPNNGTGKGSGNGNGGSPSGQGGAGGNTPPNATPPSGAGGGSKDTQTVVDPDKIQPEKPGDWKRPLPCSDVFCLTVQLIYKKASSYQQTDNCIACHIQKMNDAFKQTLDRNVAPSKVTGNIGEGSKCKRQILNLKWNLVLIPQPIITPPNDDLVTRADFTKNIRQFFELYYSNPGRCQGAVGGACKPDPDPLMVTSERALAQATDQVSQSKILQDIADQLAAGEAQARTLLAQTKLTSEGTAQASEYRVLLQQINTMNSYFTTFVKLFSQMSSTTDQDAPCAVLHSKAQCD